MTGGRTDKGTGGGPADRDPVQRRRIATLEEVLDFWFVPDGRERWFCSTPEFDALIGHRFRSTIEAASTGALDHWADSPGRRRGAVHPARPASSQCLARHAPCLRPRRGGAQDRRRRHRRRSPCAPTARAPSVSLLAARAQRGSVRQQRSCGLMADLGDTCVARYAHRHRAVIARFGRFPHRNAILGRVSTPEEEAFLRRAGIVVLDGHGVRSVPMVHTPPGPWRPHSRGPAQLRCCGLAST